MTTSPQHKSDSINSRRDGNNMSKSTKKRILLLGFAVLLIKQINVEAAIEHNQGQ